MANTDLSLTELWDYRPVLDTPSDLDAFWADTLEQARAFPLQPDFESVDTGLTQVRTFDVTFPGHDGAPIRGWFHLPASAGDGERLPAVVQYIGYGGGRGLAHENTLWAQAGYAHFVMDTRGQGSTWSVGATPDPESSGMTFPGQMTRGILDPATYYYRRVYTDAVRAVETVRSHPSVDAARVAVTGGSQGGALSLAVAALVPDLIGVMPDVPFLSHFRRAVEITEAAPYTELSGYLKVHRDHAEAVFRTLSYFDAAVLASRANAPALFSIAMMDRISPPSTCFAAYHAYQGEKDVKVYEFNDHEGGAGFHQIEQLRGLRSRL